MYFSAIEVQISACRIFDPKMETLQARAISGSISFRYFVTFLHKVRLLSSTLAYPYRISSYKVKIINVWSSILIDY